MIRESEDRVCEVGLVIPLESLEIVQRDTLAHAIKAKEFGTAMRNRNVTSVHYGVISASFPSNAAR